MEVEGEGSITEFADSCRVHDLDAEIFSWLTHDHLILADIVHISQEEKGRTMSSFKRRVPSTKPSTSISQTASIPSTSEPPSISAPESASPHSSSLSTHPSLRPSPTSSSTLLTSTGLPSLDDILGGGLPLSCSFLVLGPDVHSAYGELVCKYAVSMGLAGGMAVWVVGGQWNSEEKDWVEECMWMPGVGGVKAGQGQGQGEDDAEGEGEDGEGEEGSKIKIAWRYEQMKKFQTTVNASNAYVSSYSGSSRRMSIFQLSPPAAFMPAYIYFHGKT